MATLRRGSQGFHGENREPLHRQEAAQMISRKPNSPKNPSTPFVLLTAKQAAKALGFTPKTLECWRALDKGPPYVQCSDRTIRYRMEDLKQWTAERTRLLRSE
jgi:hypothetical protein